MQRTIQGYNLNRHRPMWHGLTYAVGTVVGVIGAGCGLIIANAEPNPDAQLDGSTGIARTISIASSNVVNHPVVAPAFSQRFSSIF